MSTADYEASWFLGLSAPYFGTRGPGGDVLWPLAGMGAYAVMVPPPGAGECFIFFEGLLLYFESFFIVCNSAKLPLLRFDNRPRNPFYNPFY